MKKINLNKRTLRVLTPAEEALVSGGTDSTGLEDGDIGDDGGDGGDGDGGNMGDGGGGSKPPPKGTFDSECRCTTDNCPPTQKNGDKNCPQGTGD